MFLHHDVPYRSQWMSPSWVEPVVLRDADPCDDPHWLASGFSDPQDYRFWSWRTCGLACLESALSHWRMPALSRAATVAQGLAEGFYQLRDDGSVHGLIYAPFVRWAAQHYGLGGRVCVDVPLRELALALAEDTMLLISVSPEIRAPHAPNTRKGGHLVLVTGATAQGIQFHNPSGTGLFQSDVFLDYDTVDRFYAMRGVVLQRPAHAQLG